MSEIELVMDLIDNYIVVDEDEDAGEVYDLCSELQSSLVVTTTKTDDGVAEFYAAPPILLRGSPAGTTIGETIVRPDFQAGLFDDVSLVPATQRGTFVVVDQTLTGGQEWADIAAVGTLEEPTKSTTKDLGTTSAAYANVEAPSRVASDAEFDILVSLEAFRLDDSSWHELNAQPGDLFRCHLSTRGAGGVVDGAAKFIQFQGDGSSSCVFRVRAPSSGSTLWIVRLYGETGSLVADVRSTVHVHSELDDPEVTTRREPLAPEVVDLGLSPEIKLIVTRQEGVLHFAAWAHGVVQELGTQVIGNTPEVGLTQFLNDLSLIPDSTEDEQDLELEIDALSSFVWQNLLSVEARDFLLAHSLEDEPRTLMIDSAEPMIPWEMARMSELGSDGEPSVKGHLCEVFDVAREASSRSSSAGFHVGRIGWVSVVDSGLAAAKSDRLAVQQTASPSGPDIELIVADPLGLTDALQSGEYDLFHFVGHGMTQRSRRFGSAALELNGGKRFLSIAIGTAEITSGLHKTRPFVFLNTCHAGSLQVEFGRAAGWAEAFMQGGAGGFLGCHWAVSDDLAAEFAREFYSEVRTGTTVAKAVRLARNAIRQEGDPTWLAYTLHANPKATFRFAEAD